MHRLARCANDLGAPIVAQTGAIRANHCVIKDLAESGELVDKLLAIATIFITCHDGMRCAQGRGKRVRTSSFPSVANSASSNQPTTSDQVAIGYQSISGQASSTQAQAACVQRAMRRSLIFLSPFPFRVITCHEANPSKAHGACGALQQMLGAPRYFGEEHTGTTDILEKHLICKNYRCTSNKSIAAWDLG